MADTQPPKKKFGFKDLRTAAELALAPGRPLSRNPPPIANVQFGGKFGAFAKAAALTGAGFAAFSSALAQKQSLSSLSASITASLSQFDAQANLVLAGKSAFKDTSVFGLASTDAVATGGFFSATDLLQFSSQHPGPIDPANVRAMRAQIDARKKSLTNLTGRISVNFNNFSVFGAAIKESFDRTAYPLKDDIDRPSVPRLAQGGDAAKKDPTLQDKRRFTVKGAVSAIGKPKTWARLLPKATDLLFGYRLQPGFNIPLNMNFADKKTQPGWSEPATPYAGQFPFNKVTQTESGHLIELDDTPGAERVHIFHRAGTFIEMHPNGNLVVKSMNHGYLISMADQYVKVRGTCNISVDGDARIYAKGQVHVQSENDVNVRTEKDFNVYAKNINLRAKKNVKVDGIKIDLRYATLPGTPVFTMNGPAVRINMNAVREDFPDVAATIDAAVLKHRGEIQRERAKMINTLIPTIRNASTSIFAGTGIATGIAVGVQALSALKMFNLLQGGPFPTFGIGGDEGSSAQLPPEIKAPEIPDELVPVENPLGNPLFYYATSPAAINYRGMLFDTPEEVGDAQMYQAHKETCQRLGDFPAVEPALGGKLTQPNTGLIAPTALPLVKYLNRDDYRGQASFSPSMTLGGTTFTLFDLTDSLARPDVANPIVTETPTA